MNTQCCGFGYAVQGNPHYSRPYQIKQLICPLIIKFLKFIKVVTFAYTQCTYTKTSNDELISLSKCFNCKIKWRKCRSRANTHNEKVDKNSVYILGYRRLFIINQTIRNVNTYTLSSGHINFVMFWCGEHSQTTQYTELHDQINDNFFSTASIFSSLSFDDFTADSPRRAAQIQGTPACVLCNNSLLMWINKSDVVK